MQRLAMGYFKKIKQLGILNQNKSQILKINLLQIIKDKNIKNKFTLNNKK